MSRIMNFFRTLGSRSASSGGGQRMARRMLNSSDPGLTESIEEALIKQTPDGKGSAKTSERAAEMSGSFMPDTPVTVGKATGQEMLSTGSVDAPPSGTFLGDYDEYFSGGLPMRLPPETVKDRLALPSANKADTLYRAKTTPGADQFEGVAGPQGSPPTTVFREPRPGGGRQTVTPGGTFTGAVTDVEQIADKRDLKHGTWRDTQ